MAMNEKGNGVLLKEVLSAIFVCEINTRKPVRMPALSLATNSCLTSSGCLVRVVRAACVCFLPDSFGALAEFFNEYSVRNVPLLGVIRGNGSLNNSSASTARFHGIVSLRPPTSPRMGMKS